MARQPALTLAFLEAQPRSAAGVLQQLDPEAAAAFLAASPVNLAARTLGEMTPVRAARCLSHMDSARVAALLATMRSAHAVHLLRLLDTRIAQGILEESPRAVASAYQRSLAYPPGSVGAWTDHSTPFFREHDLAQDALAWLGEARDVTLSHVFIVDEDQKLAGAAPLAALLAAPRRSQLGELARRAPPSFAARLPLDAAAKSPSWDEYLVLPVVDEQNVAVGSLTRVAVRRGLEATHEPARPDADRSITALLFGALLATLHGMVTALLTVKEPRT